MFNIREYRNNPAKLSDLLPWAGLVAPGVILNKDGSFQRTFSFRGPDLDSATKAELVAIAARLNNVFKRLESGWAIFAEARRSIATKYPEPSFSNDIAYLIDEERRAHFQEKAHFESFFYLTLMYLPVSDQATKIADTFIENRVKGAVSYQGQLNDFILETNRIFDLIQGVLPEISPLTDCETLTYLHSTVSFKRHHIVVPEIPMYLDALLADSPLVGGLQPKVGKNHIQTISVLSYPGSSLPGILDSLNRLAVEYRWVNRFIPLGKTDAIKEIGKYRQKWFSKRKSVSTLLKEVITKHESRLFDPDSELKAYDAEAALQEVSDDLVSYGFFTASIVVWDSEMKRLEAKVRAVEKVVNSAGFATITEQMNAVDAWLGAIPGHARANVRRPLVNSLNLTHLMPVSAVWAGPDRNMHLDGPVLLHAETTGDTPFRLSLHVGDVGHTMIVGPTGSGKDVLMATMQAQFLRYRDAQIYIFDKGGSSRVLTHGVGGDFYDLGTADEGGLSFQPLSGIDNERERSWAQEWVIGLLSYENVEITPQVKVEVWAALSSLSFAPKEQRTISGLIALIQDGNLRQALHTYSIDGPHGLLLDATSDSLSFGRWQSFEMETLMQTPAVVAPILNYVFHRLEARFSEGKPTMLFLNEAWVFLDHPQFAAKIREWLKVLRKANVSVVFATQGLADVEESSITSALIESCPTRIFLPNPAAREETASQTYRRFGLNERQIEILSVAQPKRHYYYQSPLGNRLFELGLGPFQLAYLASTGKEHQMVVRRIISEYGMNHFNEQWLKFHGLDWAVELLEAA